jgi:hypothetical protein
MDFLKIRRAAMDMGSLFIGFILIIVGLALYPSVDAAVTTALVNASAMSTAILNLIPLIWVLVVCGIGVSMVYEQFKGL